MRTFSEYLEDMEREPQWELSTAEAMRDINTTVSKTLDMSRGINDIKFEVVSTQRTSGGFKITLEGQGTTNKEALLKKQLANLAEAIKKPLSQKGIYMEILYNTVNATGPEFMVMCVAIVNSEKHRRN